MRFRPRRKLLEFLISELKELMPDATWSAAGIGRHQLEVNQWCLELGGHVRTGLEDNIKFDKDRLARSNAELVSRLATIVRAIRTACRKRCGGPTNYCNYRRDKSKNGKNRGGN